MFPSPSKTDGIPQTKRNYMVMETYIIYHLVITMLGMLNVISRYYEITLEALNSSKVMVCVSLMSPLMASSPECSSPAHVLLMPPS